MIIIAAMIISHGILLAAFLCRCMPCLSIPAAGSSHAVAPAIAQANARYGFFLP